MLMRREYAPLRSPRSFSNGGGLRKGSAARMPRSSSAFGRSPAEVRRRVFFFESGVKTMLQSVTNLARHHKA